MGTLPTVSLPRHDPPSDPPPGEIPLARSSVSPPGRPRIRRRATARSDPDSHSRSGGRRFKIPGRRLPSCEDTWTAACRGENRDPRYIRVVRQSTAFERPTTGKSPSWRGTLEVVVSTAMIRYELEIRESDGWVTHAIHDSPDEVRYDTGDQVKHKGRTLRVTTLKDPSRPPFDQRLICTPQ